ncbi:MAG TPA: COX15/CtaA family protein [Blastocatellia bacterium]|nr:COX15/CtaA family protein [Blastocatellia bacterium]
MLKHKEDVNDSGGVVPDRGLHRLTILLASMTLMLLVAGALVTSNEAGDSVPDWPLSFGRWVISSNHFIANVRFEYSHRVIAFLVGATTLALAIRAWMAGRPLTRKLALIAFAGVVGQALIGGARVSFPAYKPLIAVPHALVAQSFFGLIVTLAVLTSAAWHRAEVLNEDPALQRARRLAIITVCALLVQAALGAGFRHRAFGVAPHIAGAIVVSFITIWTVLVILRRQSREAYLRRPAIAVLVLLSCQVTLGILAYAARLKSYNDPQPLEPMITLTVAHVIVGALTLASVVVLGLRCWRTLTLARQRKAMVRVSLNNESIAAA